MWPQKRCMPTCRTSQMVGMPGCNAPRHSLPGWPIGFLIDGASPTWTRWNSISWVVWSSASPF